MPYTTINKSLDYFNTVLYTGNGASTHQITGVGFQPDWNWHKIRNDTDWHMVNDAVRGANYAIYPNATNAQGNVPTGLKSFDSDGFTVGSLPDSNQNNGNFVSWNWKANGQGSSNTDGSINTTYTSANTTAGFSIIQYTGNGSAGATIGHGLGTVPKMFIVKKISSTGAWNVYHEKIGNTGGISLDLTGGTDTNILYWNNTSPTSSVLSLGSSSQVNGSGVTYICYVFSEKQGYSKFGSYTGNNNADGAFVYTGFKPAFLMVKYTGAGQNWIIIDNKRNTYNLISAGDSLNLRPNTSDAEQTSNGIDLLSNGFKCRSSDGDSNGYTTPYIYMAFAEAPLVGSNNVPCTAR